MILPNGGIVAVLDGHTLRLFRNRAHEPHVELVESPQPDLGTAHAGTGGHHHSGAANPDHGRLDEDAFAAAAAAYLNREALAGAFAHLVVVADPRTLGELRRHFHAALKTRLLGELAKDLVKQPVAAIKDAVMAA